MNKGTGSVSALNSTVVAAIEKNTNGWLEDEKREYILMNLLPTYTHDGNLTAVKDILEHYKLDFLEAGEMDYVGNGESADPGDFVLDNLLQIAIMNEDRDMIRYFIKELQRRGVPFNDYLYNAAENVFEEMEEERRENMKRALLMRRKLPNNIALREIPKYLANNVFKKNNINRLQSEKLSNQNMNKYFGNKKGGSKTRQRRRTLGTFTRDEGIAFTISKGRKVCKTQRRRRN